MFSPQNCAPEVLEWQDRSYPSDIFSLATVLLEMATCLNNRSVRDLRDFLKEQDQIPSVYSKCLPGITKWIDYLQGIQDGEDVNKIPLLWALKGLEKQDIDRPTVHELWQLMNKDTRLASYPFACHKMRCRMDQPCQRGRL